jgi:predicted transcriptional regulator
MDSSNDKTALKENIIDDVHISDLHHILEVISDPIRLQILERLSTDNSIRLEELAKHLDMKDHTKVLFHIGKLKDIGIIDHQDNESYVLTQKGLRFIEGLEKLQWNTCK